MEQHYIYKAALCMYAYMEPDLRVHNWHSGNHDHMAGGRRQGPQPFKHHVPTLRVYHLHGGHAVHMCLKFLEDYRGHSVSNIMSQLCG